MLRLGLDRSTVQTASQMINRATMRVCIISADVNAGVVYISVLSVLRSHALRAAHKIMYVWWQNNPMNVQNITIFGHEFGKGELKQLAVPFLPHGLLARCYHVGIWLAGAHPDGSFVGISLRHGCKIHG